MTSKAMKDWRLWGVAGALLCVVLGVIWGPAILLAGANVAAALALVRLLAAGKLGRGGYSLIILIGSILLVASASSLKWGGTAGWFALGSAVLAAALSLVAWSYLRPARPMPNETLAVLTGVVGLTIADETLAGMTAAHTKTGSVLLVGTASGDVGGHESGSLRRAKAAAARAERLLKQQGAEAALLIVLDSGHGVSVQSDNVRICSRDKVGEYVRSISGTARVRRGALSGRKKTGRAKSGEHNGRVTKKVVR